MLEQVEPKKAYSLFLMVQLFLIISSKTYCQNTSQTLNESNQLFQSIHLYYLDSLPNKLGNWIEFGKTITYIDGNYIKPPVFKLVVKLNGFVLNGEIEIFIEEHICPAKSLLKHADSTIKFSKQSYWGYHKTLANLFYNNKKASQIALNGIDYQILYRMDSRIFPVTGFRIVACFYSKDRKIVKFYTKEFIFPID